jgi:lipopolysaccharide exporter
MSSQPNWFRSGFLTLLERGTGMVFTFGAAILLLRHLSKEDFATWGLFLLLSYFIEMGRNGLIQNGLIRYIGLHREDRETVAAISSAGFALNLVYALSANLVFWLSANWLAIHWQMPQLPALVQVYLLTNVVLVFYSHLNFVQQAHFEFRGIFWSTFFYRGILFLWLAVAVWSGHGIYLKEVAWVMLLGVGLGALASGLFGARWVQWRIKPDTVWMWRLLQFGKYVLGTNLSAMLYKSIDKLALGHLVGPAAFAVYDAAGKVTQLVEAPSFSIAAVVFPHGARTWENSGKAGIKALYERSVGAILAIILPFLCFILLFSEPVMLLFAGPEYLESAGLLRWTAFFGLFMPFAVQFGSILDATGRPALNFKYTGFTALLNGGLSIVLIKVFGLYGAAYATLIGYSISFILMQRLLWRMFGIVWWRAFTVLPELYRIGFQTLKIRLNRA